MKTKTLKITDLNGAEITIDDLQLAIMQADDFRHYCYLDPALEAKNEKLQHYWEDIYQKLIQLQA